MKKLFKKIYKKDKESFYKIVKKNLKENNKMFIVTANPETFMLSVKDDELNNMLEDNNTILVPDGIGVVKAGRSIGYNINERITGIDISYKLLEYGNELKNQYTYLVPNKKY